MGSIKNDIELLLLEAIPHIFLPKRTPPSEQDDLMKIETFILRKVEESLSEVIDDSPLQTELHPVKEMLSAWNFLQPKTLYERSTFAERFHEAISSPEIATIPIYVREQNCALIFSKEDDEEGATGIRVEAFRTSLPTNVVMSNFSNLFIEFPQTSEIVQDAKLLNSEVFAKALYDLTVNEANASTPKITTKNNVTSNNDREVKEPHLITDWLIGILSPETQSNLDDDDNEEKDYPFKGRIKKKIRDQVTLKSGGSSTLRPFRRNGLWTSLKVILQLKLMRLFQDNEDEQSAKLLYKILILHILSHFSKMYFDQRHTLKPQGKLDLDLMSQMLTKLGNRARKLHSLAQEMSESQLHKKIESFQTSLLNKIYEVSKEMNEFLQSGLIAFQKKERNTEKQLPSRSLQEYKDDLHHYLPFLNNFKELHANSEREITVEGEEIKKSLNLKRFHTSSSILEEISSKNSNSNKNIWLYDTEAFLKTSLSLNIEPDSTKILDVVRAYLNIALNIYKENPLGMSQLILSILKAVEELDRRAVAVHPLLSKYRCGIKAESFSCLLLPHKDDLLLLETSLEYFRSRDKAAETLENILTSQVRHSSLPVRFVEGNPKLLKILEETIQKQEEDIQKKTKEVEQAREACKELQNQIALEPSCKCVYKKEEIRNHYGALISTRSILVTKCRRCILQELLESKRKSVGIFERPLPSEEHLKKAVIFELHVPTEIFLFRECLAILQYGLLSEPELKFMESNQINNEWADYGRLGQYLISSRKANYQADIVEAVVRFGSSCLPFSATHASKHCPDLLCNKNSNFISDNGLLCIYTWPKHSNGDSSCTFLSPIKKTPKELCTFKISNAANSEIYSNLERYLSSYQHSQNEVICNQDDCSLDLTLEEFVAFGSVRCGHRIQLRNLYKAIASNLLSLREEPVLSLLLQTIWELGPRNQENFSELEAHFDFENNSEFCLEFLDLLEETVKINEAKYTNPCLLLGAVAITTRIMELQNHPNQLVFDRGYELLKCWRKLMKIWQCKLDEQIKKEKMEKEENVEEFQKNLLIIKVASAISFNFSSSIAWKEVMREEESIKEWFHTISALNQMSDHIPKLSIFMQTLLNYGKDVRLQLNLEEEAVSNPLISSAVQSFVEEKWDRALECEKPPAIRYKNLYKKNLVELKYIEKEKEGECLAEAKRKSFVVTFDVILGTFLVNGSPPGYLPNRITNSSAFFRYFTKKNSKIDVQSESNGLYRTVERFHGKHYEFHLVDDDDGNPLIIIKEIQDQAGSNRILLENLNFHEKLAPFLVSEYTHWYDYKNDIVYFRRTCKPDGDFDLPHEYKMIRSKTTSGLSLDSWLLYDENRESFLLSIESEGFQDVMEFLSRLELPQYINILLMEGSSEKEELTVHLPRYSLRFKIKKGSILESVDFPKYTVIGEGNTETLLGLQQGIQLRKGEKRILLLPHGNIQLGELNEEDEEEHELPPLKPYEYQHKTQILLKNLKQPSYFVYEFDEVLKRLVGNKSKLPYIYLAALHAVTSLSSGLPDPFTGLTGTEMAVRILQSGFIWSSNPFEANCRGHLDFIKSLSPERKYYGNSNRGMETVEWKNNLPSMSAYDGFSLIVGKLMEDSGKLNVLNDLGEKSGRSELSDTDFLHIRSYFRHLSSYNDLARVTLLDPASLVEKKKKCPSHSEIQSTSSEPFQIGNLHDFAYVKSVVPLQNLNSSEIKAEPNGLRDFLHASFTPGTCGASLSWDSSINDVFDMDFRTIWYDLYEMAKEEHKTFEKNHIFTLILSAMAYTGVALEQLLNLHYISQFSDQLAFPQVPEECHANSKNGTEIPNSEPSEKEVKSAFYSVLWDCTYQDRFARIERLNEAASHIKNQIWPDCLEKTSFLTEYLQKLDYMKVNNAAGSIKAKVNLWLRERKIRNFIQNVQQKLNQIQEDYLSQSPVPILPSSKTEFEESSAAKLRISKSRIKKDFISSIQNSNSSLNLNQDVLEEAQHIFKTGRLSKLNEISAADKTEAAFLQLQEEEKLKWILKEKQFMNNILHTLSETKIGKILELSCIRPRTDPTSLIHLMINHRAPKADQFSIPIYAGALAVIWTNLKRLNRLISYQSLGQTVELEKELQTEGHENWSPQDFPEWLCLELELDIMIRPKQVEVAFQMMEMPNGGNGVMQLNMGEGKTSVIVPMLCCSRALKGGGGKHLIPRVTVLASMLNMNYKTLSFAIGKLINNRVYVLPCRRDMKITLKTVETIRGSYEECMELRGVILALPEHRLSFRLLAYDNILKGKEGVKLGRKLWETERFLREHVRNFLDESDELLNVKYQLVYTVGEKIDLDGGNLRWECCQKLLKIVQEIAPRLRREEGKSVLELNLEKLFDFPHQFADFRILDSKIHHKFISVIADKVLEEFMISRTERIVVRKFLIQEQLEEDVLGETLRIFNEDENALKKILTYSGYLRRGILSLGLSKRWRVEFGVDASRESSRLAVPYRAKDCPAERTEFGHPDLAILLTHLSYYYSGLSFQQLDDVLNILETKPGADAIYGSWMRQFLQDEEDTIPPNLRNYRSLNMKDSLQRRELFKLLKHHMLVIDFWLGNKVLPRESKQFPHRMAMTAWDLCYERNSHPTTGFSGTNDTRDLLPLQISQQDLPSLLNTNAAVEEILLQKENGDHSSLKMGVTCREILEEMRSHHIKVLIDAGALMLELDNEQVAELWLEIDSELEGALYFNEKNEMMVKFRGKGSGSDVGRKMKGISLELTPYQNCLDKIGVFLDDQHTRGTDLKFPTVWKAAVTVGPKMKRDKLIQACMRMRKLGNGQSVSFYLSNEVVDKIKKRKKINGDRRDANRNEKTTTLEVLEWVKENTKDFIEDGLLYWAIAGRSYAQRLAAEDNFCHGGVEGGKENEMGDKANILAKQCLDKEVTTLMQMYGEKTNVDLLVKVIPSWFKNTMQGLVRSNNDIEMDVPIKEKFGVINDLVVERCNVLVPEKIHSSSGEEEKECELEKEAELEEEITREKRGNPQPVPHKLRKNVRRIVEFGGKLDVMKGIESLPDIFKDTKFWDKVQPNAWVNGKVYASTDFISVVKDDYTKTDHFLRPMEYFVSVSGGQGNSSSSFSGGVLLLNLYEVNELIPLFRRGTAKTVLHMFSPRMSENQELLWSNPRLTLPQNVMKVSLSKETISALLLGSGNWYFGNMKEQKSFVKFLSLAPMPWSEEEQSEFDEKLITKTCFMLEKCKLRGREGVDVNEGFKCDPSELVRLILACRHSVVNENAHVSKILDKKELVLFK